MPQPDLSIREAGNDQVAVQRTAQRSRHDGRGGVACAGVGVVVVVGAGVVGLGACCGLVGGQAHHAEARPGQGPVQTHQCQS